MVQLLAGDIGGTKTILRLVNQTENGTDICREATYVSADYDHLTPMVRQFLTAGLDHPPDERPRVACFAIAGPVKDDHSQLSNLSWELDARQLEADLNIPTIRLINDFAAVGYGILELGPDDLVVVQDNPRVEKAPIAVLGAGTGLGEALLVWQQGQYEVMATEGGHTDFAPRNNLEIGLLQFLLQEHDHVSVERVVSGMGIRSIYDYLNQTGVATESEDVKARMVTEDKAAVITEYALADTDPLCTQTLDLFVKLYGAEAGNIALKSLADGGVYIAGGIGAKILPKLKDGTFIANFLDKGRMRSLLEAINVSLITNPNVGLMGAALYARRLLQAQ